jgi:Protein of unknown function (DUF1499)
VRLARRVTTALVATVLVLVALGLTLRIYMGREAEDRLAVGEAVSIAELRSPLPKPSFLACPPGYCSAAAAASPVFDLPWDRLRDFWLEVISGEKRLVSVAADHPEPRRLAYVQHSPIFRFPDIVTVEFVPLGPNRSSIAIFSRSRYGEYDFSKNRKRVERWLFLLQRVALPATPRRIGL